jgi:ABC-2 type transport system permease protein
LPFFVRAVQLYAAANLPQAAFLAPDARMFRQYLEQQEPFLFFITVYAGAGLIANDRRANALQIYLSKPLTRGEYVFGKLAVLMTFLLLVSWVPAVVLLIVQIVFSGSFRFFLDNLFLFPAITVFSFIQVLAVSMAMLALSSLSNSSRYVGILYAGLIFFSQAIYGVVYAVTRDSTLSWMSLPFDLNQLGDAIFRLPLRYSTPLPAAALAVALLIGASALVLERRVKGVEVVA